MTLRCGRRGSDDGDAPNKEILASRGEWIATAVLTDKGAFVSKPNIHAILHPELSDGNQGIMEGRDAPHVLEHDVRDLVVISANREREVADVGAAMGLSIHSRYAGEVRPDID